LRRRAERAACDVYTATGIWCWLTGDGGDLVRDYWHVSGPPGPHSSAPRNIAARLLRERTSR
jgi:hypothetical protein